MNNIKNVLITGGNRGIGLGLLKLFSVENNVIITVRDEEKGQKALDHLKDVHNKKIDYVVMDVDDNESVLKASKEIARIYSSVDILINNAGILLSEYDLPALQTSEESIIKTFNTNTLGALRVCKAILPLMNDAGRIINISSGMGQLEDMEGGSIAYRISKTSLNTLTVVLSKELKSKKIKVNTICPGWVKTDMGGQNATLTIEESTSKIVAFALSDDFPNGKFLRHGVVIPW